MAVLSGAPGIRVSIVSMPEGSGEPVVLDELPGDEDRNRNWDAPQDRLSFSYLECTPEVESSKWGIKFEITPEYIPKLGHTYLTFGVFADRTSFIGAQAIRCDYRSPFMFTTVVAKASETEMSHQKLKFRRIERGENF